VLPAIVSQAAHVKVTRVEPEIFVPPLPGQEVRRASGLRRDQALFFDGMERKLPIGLSRDGEPVFANLDFLDGSRGAHVNISGISGVATKTSYATFLLHSLLRSGALGGDAASTHALVFNVKGEDLWGPFGIGNMSVQFIIALVILAALNGWMVRRTNPDVDRAEPPEGETLPSIP